MKEIELRTLGIDIGQSDDEELIVSGYIQTNTPSHVLGKIGSKRWREVIESGVFERAINRAMNNNSKIDFLMEHDKTKILSSTSNNSLILDEDDVGLYIRAKISKTSWGKDLFTLVKDGIIKGLSFGMLVNRSKWSTSNDGIPLRIITDIDLYEVSALKTPAYPATLIEARGFATVEDVEVPDDIENRNLGGNGLNEETELSPQKFYDGLTLIAEKLDNVVTKLSDIEEQRTSQSLEDAKELLTKTEAMIEAQAKQNNVTVDENGEEISVDEAEVEEEVENEATETVEPDPDSGEDTETIENDENDQPDEKIIEEEEEKKKKRTETRSLEDENDQNGCEIDEPEDEKVEPDEEIEAKNEENDKKTTDNDEKVDNSQEFRTLLEKFKTEVPEIE